MSDIVSIFQAPLWKKIVVSSNNFVGYASSYFILKNSVTFNWENWHRQIIRSFANFQLVFCLFLLSRELCNKHRSFTDIRELKQRRQPEVSLSPFLNALTLTNCIAKDLSESFKQTTAQWCKNYTSGWRPPLNNAVA